MKRFISLFLAMLMLFSLTAGAYADDGDSLEMTEYTIPESGVAVSLPADMYVITRDSIDGDASLEALGLTADFIISYFESIGIYFDAFDGTVEHEIVVSCAESELESSDYITSLTLRASTAAFETQYESMGYTVTSTELYKNDNYTFIKLNVEYGSDDATDNLIQYIVISNYTSVVIAYHCYSGDITEEDEALALAIADSISFSDPTEEVEAETAADAKTKASGSGIIG